MPIYEFQCPKCLLGAEDFRKVTERNRVKRCPQCKSRMDRLVSLPGLVKVPGGNDEAVRGQREGERIQRAMAEAEYERRTGTQSRMEMEEVDGLLRDREKDKGLPPNTLTGGRPMPKTEVARTAVRERGRKKITEARKQRRAWTR